MESLQLRQLTTTVPAFSVDDVVAALIPETLDLDFCRRWILQRLHPGGPLCPRCESPVQGDRPLASWWQDRRVCCKECRAYFSNRSGTFVQGSELGWRDLFLLAALSGHGLPVDRIASAVGCHPDTVHHWRRTLDALTRGPA